MAEGNATMEVRARLTADTAQFTKGMSQASSAMNGMISQTSKFHAGMVGAGVAAAAFSTALIAFGTKAFMAAARVDELDYAMNAVGRSTGLGFDKLNDTAVAIRAVGIEMEVAQKMVLKFAQNNLDLALATQLASTAQDFAVISGENSTETLNKLTHAVITGRSEVLKSVGINKSAGQMYEEFGRTIGKAASALTYQEKQQAVANGAISEGARIAGTYKDAMKSPGKLLRSFARLNNELQVAMGGVLVKGFGPLIFSAYNLQKSFVAAIYGSEAFKNVIKAVQMVLIKLTAPIAVAMDKLKAFFDGMLQGNEVIGGLTDKLGKGGKSITELAGKIEFLLPPIAALLAALSAYAGSQIFTQVPILGALFRGLGGPVGIALTAFVAMALTSTQVRDAFGNLATALQPLLAWFAKLGGVIVTIAGYAVSLFARALNGLASIIRTTTSFLGSHIAILNVLKGVVFALVGAFIALKVVQAAQSAKIAVMSGLTALYGAVTGRTAVALATQAVATAGLTLATARQAVAQAMANMESAIASGSMALQAAATEGLIIANAGLATATGAMTVAQTNLNVVMGMNPIMKVVLAISALIAAFVLAWQHSETFRNIVTQVFNKVANIIGKVLSFIFKVFGNLLLAYGELISSNNAFGKVIAAVYQFIYSAVLTVFIGIVKMIKFVIDAFISLMENQGILGKIIETVINFIIKAYLLFYKIVLTVIKNVLDAFVSLFEGHETLRKIVETVFNVVIAIISHAVQAIIVVLANIIKGIATLIHWFEMLGKFIGDVWGKIVAGIEKAKEFIGQVLSNLGNIISGIITYLKEKLASFFLWLYKQVDKLPDLIPGVGILKNGLMALANSLTAVEKADNTFKPSMGASIATAAGKAIDLAMALDSKIISASKSWGNYTGGVAGTLSGIANKMLDFAVSVNTFATKDNGSTIMAGLISGAKTASTFVGGMIDKIKEAEQINFGAAVVDTLVAGAKLASDGLGKIIDKMEEMKDIKVGEFIVDTASDAAIKAGNFLIGLATSIESFTSGDVLGKITEGFGDMLGGLKTGLGFGDVGADMEKFIKSIFDPTKFDNKAVEETISGVDRMKAIRSALQQGIDAIKGVLDDLQQAAKDFADSLKDTIIGFAGLKGVELPDGFIPQAKSLIENMRMRLDKSQQFATQIAQLQAYGLDAGALKAIIEEGPIKGAQLAASILGGNAAENIQQINALQKAISFTGAAIGQFGADAAYSDLIANAKNKYDSINKLASTTDAQLVKSQGNNVLVQEGAFKVAINVAGLTGQDQVDAITKAIDAQFQVLAKELAAK